MNTVIRAALAATMVCAAVQGSAASPAPATAGRDITAPGPHGALAGTYMAPAGEGPVILIIPGSGPTDRDGNNPLGVTAAPYRLLAEALGAEGIGSLRIDKRGMFGSKAAVPDPNAVTIADYVADVEAWTEAARAASGRSCIWLLGHSEGGLVALAAAQRTPTLCGIILVSASGEALGQVMRAQLRRNPANAPILADAFGAIDRLEKGERADVSAMHPALQQLFAPAVQAFLIDLFRHDPAELAADVRIPMLIVEGGEDLQVPAGSAAPLRKANAGARYRLVPGMNHVLKQVPPGDAAANMAAYAGAAQPVSPGLVAAIAEFVRRQPLAGR
ncbi:alpha/beta fold hydrolase [Altererythrobacter aerius]|uniref:Alpha/beta fold hydrolase n=1 Tax=Tsuneonella aeria TaxID=1837929 RepID=A0A6I4THP7_9SPHN|nr:alpha/beta fold hydrolase [Tsuneonella aeria]MXO75580.1 alpha/beta fold hydrolase [Tsuneonella aeria]